MAKIDITSIEGFADMTPEEKLEALQGYDFPDPDYSGYVKKDLYDKAASNAAEWKRKHNALLTAEEQQKQEQADSLAAMQAELETLRKEKIVANHTADFVKLGYDAKLAEETAVALADGDNAKVFANQQKFLETYKKTIIADELKKTPRPQGGQGGNEVTKEKFLSMGTKEQQEFIQNNPDWQKTLK